MLLTAMVLLLLVDVVVFLAVVVVFVVLEVVVALVVVAAVVELLLEWSLELLYMYLPILPLSYIYPLVGQPPLFLSNSLLNFPYCLSITLLCLDSLILNINDWYSCRVSLSATHFSLL